MSGRPRITKAGDPFPGFVLGAFLGGVLTKKVEGAAAGAAIGALGTGASSNVPLALDQALHQNILELKYNIEFVSLVRRGPFGADLSIRMDDRYRILRASAEGVKSEVERDDKLYDEFVSLLKDLVTRARAEG